MLGMSTNDDDGMMLSRRNACSKVVFAAELATWIDVLSHGLPPLPVLLLKSSWTSLQALTVEGADMCTVGMTGCCGGDTRTVSAGAVG